ncbi:MAG: nucleotidyltransferase domain-containing protein [Candidatus Brocadiaceae bacterium]
MSNDIKGDILSRLQHIEQEENVRIFYACEAGSRAWGFPSVNSDYDVRFLYIHPKNWYLSIDEKRDVIEQPGNDLLDISGWDIRKALRLFRKSNPPLLEWINSPIIYQQKLNIVEKIKALIPEYYSPKACLYHYRHMAEGNFREYLKGEVVWVKKYFYVLRPVLACKWIEAGHGIVPVRFDILVNRIINPGDLKTAIFDLLQRKKDGQELDMGPRIPVISEFIETELERLCATKSDIRHIQRSRDVPDGASQDIKSDIKPDTAKLNTLFRCVLTDIF